CIRDRHIALEPPTPEKLFQNIWEKQGYSADDAVLKDFLSLVQEAQKHLENDASH
ncbi:exonuclease sbcCD subunit D, partial [Acinetobacter baumannii]